MSLAMRNLIAPAIGLVWAGLALGGNLIAAPAKFQVTELSTQMLLQIGRAQFAWLANAEWVLLVLFCSGMIFVPRRQIISCLVPVGLFLAQRLWLMPLLNERTTRIIAGQAVPASDLHVIFVGIEAAKVAALAIVGVLLLRQLLRIHAAPLAIS